MNNLYARSVFFVNDAEQSLRFYVGTTDARGPGRGRELPGDEAIAAFVPSNHVTPARPIRARSW